MLDRHVIARVVVDIIAVRSNSGFRSPGMLTLLPSPNYLSVMAAAAPLVDRQLSTCTETSAVLAAARLGLWPRGTMKAAAHTHLHKQGLIR